VAAKSFELGYYVAGFSRGNRLSIVRGSWSSPDNEQRIDWPVGGVAWHSPVILEADGVNRAPVHERSVIAHVIGNANLKPPEQHFARDDSAPGHSLPVASPPWTTENTLAIAIAGDTRIAWELSRSAAALVLTGYGVDNVPVASKEIELPPEIAHLIGVPPVLPMPMCVNHWAVYIGLGNLLIIVRHEGPIEFLEMPETICGLACSAPHTRRRLAITFEAGGRLLWDEYLDRRSFPFASSFDRPVAGFIKPGWLVIASCDGCEVYATNDRRLSLIAECRWPDLAPIAVLDTGAAYEFAVAFTNGSIRTFRVASAP
jgi:hypothetical protein